MKENKLLETIKKNDKDLDEWIAYRYPVKFIGQTKELDEIKSYITQFRVAELEVLVDIVNQIQEVNPESNGRFNACNEMREVLEDTITQLKTN